MAAELIRTTGAGKIADSESRDQIKQAISEYYAEWKSQKRITYTADEEKIRQYERKNLTRQLVGVFERCGK